MSLSKPPILNGLAEMYDTEQRHAVSLAKLVKEAGSEHLRFIFESQLVETAGHVGILELVFATFNQEPRARKCRAALSFLKSVELDGPVSADSDAAASIAAARKLACYKISSYGCLCRQAEDLGNTGAVELLAEILQQTQDTHDLLTSLDCESKRAETWESPHSRARCPFHPGETLSPVET